MWKNLSHCAIQLCQNQGSISPPLSRKNTITLSNIWAIFARKQCRVTNQKVRIKIWQNFVNLQKHFGSSIFQFGSYKSHRTFQKNCNWIFKFGCFSCCHDYIFEINELDYLMQNLMLNQLAPISNTKKWKSKNLVCPFPIAFFILRPI